MDDKTKADIIREEIVMDAAKRMLDDLLKYPDEQIINSKTRTARVKLTII